MAFFPASALTDIFYTCAGRLVNLVVALLAYSAAVASKSASSANIKTGAEHFL